VCGGFRSVYMSIAPAGWFFGGGQALRKRHNAETELLPVTYANDYRRLAVLGRGLVASIPTGLDLS